MNEEREIFVYEWPVGTPHAADPMVINRRMTRLLGGDVNAALAACKNSEDALAELAYDKLRRAVCTAFNLGEPFNPDTGMGVLEKEWIQVLDQYTLWLEKKKPSTVKTPILPQSSEPKSCPCLMNKESPSGTTSPATGSVSAMR